MKKNKAVTLYKDGIFKSMPFKGEHICIESFYRENNGLERRKTSFVHKNYRGMQIHVMTVNVLGEDFHIDLHYEVITEKDKEILLPMSIIWRETGIDAGVFHNERLEMIGYDYESHR